MNLYIVVEGRTEEILYQNWLAYLLPQIHQVDNPSDVEVNNYYLFNAQGNRGIISIHLPDAIENVNRIGRYDYLIVDMDAENAAVSERIDEIETCLKANPLHATTPIVIVKNCCVETWFLGNPLVYAKLEGRNPLDVYTQMDAFNVAKHDPELMDKPETFTRQRQIFHRMYFRHLFEHTHQQRYKKGRLPSKLISRTFLTQLQARVNDKPTHLQTFQIFLNFCNQLNLIK